VPALGRGLMTQLQQPTATRASWVRIGLGDLAAAARAHLPGETRGRPHAPASFSTSFRMPPAVTAGPAPGPVITSGFFLYRIVVKIHRLSVPLSQAIGLDGLT